MWPFKKPQRRRVIKVKAGYDSARTDRHNSEQWKYADGLSANASLNHEARKIIRQRAREEVNNNSYAAGIVLTKIDATIGTGPRVQFSTGNETLDKRLDQLFADWAEAVRFRAKLAQLLRGKIVDGEGFAPIIDNPKTGHEITLDFYPVESDRITNPSYEVDLLDVDGIRFDTKGNPLTYKMLKAHPGDGVGIATETETVPAKNMLHLFRADRAEQRRGMSEFAPSLNFFGQLRRYTEAVISASETAANFAAVLESDAPGDDDDGGYIAEPMDVISLERGSGTVLPGGYKLGQVRAEQPSSTYVDTKREFLSEISRCHQVPFNIAALNSGGFNFASGRLDGQIFLKSTEIERATLEESVTDRLVARWLDEARRIVDELLGVERIDWVWLYDGFDYVDPFKEANAQGKRLENNITTLQDECSKRGRDWRQVLRQRQTEKALLDEYGLTPAPPPAAEPIERTDDDDASEEE